MKLLLSLITSFVFIFPSGQNLNKELETLNLSSQNYILYSVDSETVVANKNESKHLAAASINKVLTTLTALELLEGKDLDDRITISQSILNSVDIEASVAGFKAGQTVTLRDILYGIILPSGADATAIMSEYLTGSVTGLVDEMNKLAQKIGMQDTHIMNTSGLDDPNQHTTLNDLLKLILYALENEDFKEIYGTEKYRINAYDLEFENQILADANKKGFYFLEGAKSGFTDDANRALSSVASHDNLEFIFISTQAEGDFYINNEAFNDAMKVYSYLFDNFKKETLFEKNSEKGMLDIKNKWKSVVFTHTEDIEAVVPDNFDSSQLTQSITTSDEKLKAPVKENTEIGTYDLKYLNQTIYEAPLINETKISKDLVYIVVPIVLGLFLLLALWIFIQHMRIKIRRRRRH